MFSRFFIDRPIFAAVLSIVITLGGAISVFNLPLAQFPRITPPTVAVQAVYPGASAKDVAESVAAPIEERINGVEGMMYMSSQCTNDGSYNLTVTFHQGIDLNMAQVLVQNRVNLAIPNLPDVIKAAGVTTIKRSPDILMGIALNSPKGRYNQLYLSNYALRQIKDELSRVDGVGDVFLFGQRDYSMRIWIDPGKLAYRNLTPSDVVAAVRDQNATLASGMIGQPSGVRGQESGVRGQGSRMNGMQETQLPFEVLGRLHDVEQFENIIVKTMPGGKLVRLRDVARVELGAKSQDVDTQLDGSPTVFLAIFQLPDANALELRDRVIAKLEELKKNFPDDVDYDVGFDTTPYTRESIHEVFNTLRDAIILVALVVLLFLQNWRSAIIPLIAVPVAIIGTFSVMAALGFSLNNLTLFGLVLAIGIVVDDAIVVVEAVEHHIENGLAPREATIKAMQQVSGPVIAVGLVLSAVFVPCAFISGITGLFFRQFALTIAVSTIISAFNSLTLSPALTALLLRPVEKETAPPLPRLAFALLGGLAGYAWLSPWLEGAARELGIDGKPAHVTLGAQIVGAILGALVGWFPSPWLNQALAFFFRGFNFVFRKATAGYAGGVGRLLHFSSVALILYAGLVVLTYFGFITTPRGFIPNQDMGYLMVNVQLPDSASMERTQAVMAMADKITRAHPAVRHATAISGQSFALSAAGSNFGSMFVNLQPYGFRRDLERTMSAEDRAKFGGATADAIAAYLRREYEGQIHDGSIAVFGPPPVRGVGRAGGFAFVLEDRGDLGPVELQKWAERLATLGNNPRATGAVQTGLDFDSTDLNTMPDKLAELAKEHPEIDRQPGLLGMFTVFRANVPQFQIRPDPREITARKVRVEDAAATLSISQGSLYANDFNRLGRTWQVIVQADSPFRYRKEDLYQLKTRNTDGKMVPLGALGTMRDVSGPLILNRYNMYPAATINGSSGPGMSSRQAIDVMQKLADKELPHSMSFEWTDMSYLELQAGNTAMIIFGFAVVMVFLVLAAQYESWSLPLAVILVVPMCLLSAIIGVRLAGMDINIFTQIGFVVLVGLSSKNAILIVEFAKKEREAGVPRFEATLDACRLRLRPIVMTSFAFILGVLPLLVSEGAGAEMRRTLGMAVFSGMLGVTIFGIVLTPVFFYNIDRLGESPWLNTPFMSGLRAVLRFVTFGFAHSLYRLTVRR
ncbi:MAG: efflux RND transporter permease subunit [Planctomycetes bacterium]|nr:efflux RND transporter permease subunit [Planctomycetota bacterium]